MLKVNNLTVNYEKIVALDDISIHIEEGELVTVLGANGAGKTTLAKSILGLVNNASGKIIFNDEDITKVKSYERVQRGIGLIPEGSRIFPQLTVRENLLVGAFSRSNQNIIAQDMENVFQIFPILKERRKALASTFSGGQRQMLSIARGLMTKPKLLIVDEMSIGLMPVLVKELFSLLKQFTEQGISILLIEQNAKQALKISNRGYVLQNGKIAIEGNTKELINNEEVCRCYLGV